MTRRGRILRDTSVGAGLLVIDGTQYSFQLEGQWRSDQPPRTGMVIDAEFDGSGQIVAVRAVPEGAIAREQADQALQAVRERGGALAGAAVARFGMRDLTALALLVVGWFFLTAGSFGGGFMGKLEFTFWQVLQFVNEGASAIGARAMGGGGSTGLWGLLAVAALAGPFAHHFWRDRRANLAGALPLLLMVIVLWKVLGGFASAGPAGAPEAPWPRMS